MTNAIGGPSATAPANTAAQPSLPYDSITVNGKPAKIVKGEVQIPKGAKVEIKAHYDAGVFKQGPADFTLSQSGAGSTSQTAAQLKKAWKVKEETCATPNGEPVPPQQMGGMRYQTISFTAPKTADGTGLKLALTQENRQPQTLSFVPQSAQCGPVLAQPAAAPALAPAQAETAGFGGRPGFGGGHPGFGGGRPGFGGDRPGFPGGFGRPGGFDHPGFPGGGFPHGPMGPGPGFGWHRPIGRPWFNPWNAGWGAMPAGWVPGCEWNPAWGGCPPGYYMP